MQSVQKVVFMVVHHAMKLTKSLSLVLVTMSVKKVLSVSKSDTTLSWFCLCLGVTIFGAVRIGVSLVLVLSVLGCHYIRVCHCYGLRVSVIYGVSNIVCFGFSAVSSIRCGHHERHSLCGPGGYPLPAQEGQGQNLTPTTL